VALQKKKMKPYISNEKGMQKNILQPKLLPKILTMQPNTGSKYSSKWNQIACVIISLHNIGSIFSATFSERYCM